MAKELEKLKQKEADFFDQSASVRSAFGHIPYEADIRRATKFIPMRSDEDQLLRDPKINEILNSRARQQFINLVAHKPKGRVLDICCGPGWLALELGRRGQTVDAYDLSPKAITLAKKMLKENPYTEGFGSVNYHLKDVTEVDLGHEVYDAVSGWSAFHHIPNLHEFMERVYRALKPGGIVATFDDMELGALETWLARGFRVALPSYNRTYREKFRVMLGWMRGKIKTPEHVFSPMEAEKYSTVNDIEDIWTHKFDLVKRIQINAFSAEPAMTLSGPDAFRYTTARLLVGFDRFLCKIGVCKGFERILIAQKK